MKISAIITAGGTSSRFGSNKLLEKINGKTVLEYTVEKFLKVDSIFEVIICANVDFLEDIKNLFANEKIKFVQGGKTRQASVYNGLKACSSPEYVLIHDGARPLIKKEIIKAVITDVAKKNAVTVAVKTTDTIKKVDNELKIIKTVDRSDLFNTQTPQAFRYRLILEAHEKLKVHNYTDDCSMLEELGKDVYILEGDYKNIKITTQNDLDVAKLYLSRND